MKTTRTAPENLVLRPYAGEEDVRAIVDIYNGEKGFDGVPEFVAFDDMKAHYSHPSDTFDPARDVTIAEVDGQSVGFGERAWVDTNDGAYREYRCDGAVLPEWRSKGIGTALLAENSRLSRELSATHRTDRARVLGSWASDRQSASIAVMRNAGFEPVRWFFEMTRSLADQIPEVPLPDGIEVRPTTPDLVKQVWLADVEAFLDHWGGFDASDAALQRWIDRPSFDPSLWVVAWEGDEVAAAVINGIETEENAELGLSRGWLHSVFTRRQWRKRGLARALIARSLSLLKERGLDQGILGVDADNPTGALGLYEKIGFVVAERSTAWRRPLESERA